MKKPKPLETFWLSRKKFAFLQDWGTYTTQTFVAVGLKHDEILTAMRAMGCEEQLVKRYDAGMGRHKDTTEAYDPNGAFVWRGRPPGSVNLLWMGAWKNNLTWYGNLLHETAHLVKFFITDYRHMEDETEAQAYQQEYLFQRVALTCAKAIKLKHAPRPKCDK